VFYDDLVAALPRCVLLRLFRSFVVLLAAATADEQELVPTGLLTSQTKDQCASVGFPGGLKFLIHRATARATPAGNIRPTKQSK
jgi:hypothetical protein